MSKRKVLPTKKYPVVFNNMRFTSVREFDCRVVGLENEHGGGFFTALPISPYSFRKENPTKASVSVNKCKNYTTFIITDDHGRQHIVYLHNDLKEEIKTAHKAAGEQHLMKRTTIF